jgi:hypothetical protein
MSLKTSKQLIYFLLVEFGGAMYSTGILSLNMLIAMSFFVAGNIFGWYSSNMQFISEYWKDKYILSAFVFGVPSIVMFWFGTKYAMEAVPQLWSIRFIGAGTSFIAFPIMTWYYMGETMFTLKTMICTFLYFLIILVQIFLK